jgi:hypothetical protein
LMKSMMKKIYFQNFQIYRNRYFMKKILFISALKWELSVVRKLWENQPSKYLKADFLVTGMWMQATTQALDQILTQQTYDCIINIWVCWYKDTHQDILQIVRSQNAQTGKELIVPVFFEHAPLVSTLCSETPIYELETEPYVDMESYSVEQICEKHRTPRIILKVPIDKVWEETKNFDKNKALKLLEENIDMPKLITQMEKYLSSLSRKYNIEQYSTHYKLTFSENIIFERYFHKYTSVLQEDFWEFFETHKHLPKKEFLKTLSAALNNYSLC